MKTLIRRFRFLFWLAPLGLGTTAAAASTATIPSPTVAIGISSATVVTISTTSGQLEVPATSSEIDQRLLYERYNRANPFVLTAHRANYILPLAYNFRPNQQTFRPGDLDGHVQHAEVKFQLSLKVNLVNELIKNKADLYAAYTQQSYWQAYNTRRSSPFRETNYEPEAGLTIYNDWHFLGFRNRVVTLALSHQSNGQGGNSSRSWNRLFSEIIIERKNFYVSLRPWYRLPEKESDDDNPDIEKYMGYGELSLNYTIKKTLLGVMTRNNFRASNKGCIQVDWAFPLGARVRGYLQYFYGYGEDLIDYNHINHRLGLGFAISNGL